MYLNPIVKKDIKVQSRSMRICFSVFGYELILAFVFFIAMMIIESQSRYSSSNIYSLMVNLYPILGVAQIIILGMIVPIRTASAISGEKERQTFDIMMTTSMTPFSVIMGKVMSAIIQSMFFVAASLPVMALVFVIGGMSWGYLFCFFGVALLASIFAASIGIFCSSVCKKTISAVIMAYGFYVVFFLGTFVPVIITSLIQEQIKYTNGTAATLGLENSLLILLFNPAVYVFEFFVHVMSGYSPMEELYSRAQGTNGFSLLSLIAKGNVWLIVSTIIFLAVSFFFLWLASRRINPLKKRKK